MLLACTIFLTTLGTSLATLIPFFKTKLLDFFAYPNIDLFHFAKSISDISFFVDNILLSLFIVASNL